MALSLLRKSPLLLLRYAPQTRLVAPTPRCLTLSRLLSTEPPKISEPNKTGEKPLDLPKKKPSMGQNKTPMTWKTLGATVIVFSVLLQALWYLKKVRKEETDKKKVMSIGKAAIGGGFELIDSARKTVSDKDFLGKWMLIYFGFTHCPDICPEELEKMAVVIENIDKAENADPMQPLFISVDPERDTPEIIAKYTADFSPKLKGLTGTVDQVKDICKKYRIYYSAGPKEDGDYIVDHTIIMYLINPSGEFTQYYGRNKTAADITRDIVVQMGLYNGKHK
ncbi:protein SCO1 homolog, mitochondrial [Thrips palmi]|uniref:Protein SCO1 homolog, mitochondrial n=1 Tax=Thrips palmi TaxID=161013 RepID=A0A6P9AJ28_THRPL|nr:protein SCO1 homolog, mitochondrial [Thrips palmi]